MLNEGKRAYDATLFELPAEVWAVLFLRPYLEGCRFTVCTDHAVIKWILKPTDFTNKLARRQLRLVELKFDVTYCAGINMRQLTVYRD